MLSQDPSGPPQHIQISPLHIGTEVIKTGQVLFLAKDIEGRRFDFDGSYPLHHFHLDLKAGQKRFIGRIKGGTHWVLGDIQGLCVATVAEHQGYMDFRPGDALFGNGGVGSLTGVRVSIETIDFEIRRKYIPPLLAPVIRLANRSRPHMTNPHPQLVQIASSFEPGGKKRRHGHWFPHLPLILTWMLKDKPQAATVNSTRTTPNLR
ncbi:MAG: hypothetical protein Q6L19_06895, partial [Gloeomargarita sp. GMQP_bins_69]